MLKQSINGDGLWHMAIFDASEINGRTDDLTGVTGAAPGNYDGSTVAFFRLDAMECEYILNDQGQAYKDDNGKWVRHEKPEGAYIDIAYVAFFDSTEKAEAWEAVNKANEPKPEPSEPADPALPEGLSMTVEKTEFTVGEDIMVTATGEGEQWVGIYVTGDTPGGACPSIYWYYIDKDGHTSGETVKITSTNFTEDRAAYKNLPAGNYTLMLFSTGNYDIAKTIDIVIKDA